MDSSPSEGGNEDMRRRFVSHCSSLTSWNCSVWSKWLTLDLRLRWGNNCCKNWLLPPLEGSSIGGGSGHIGVLIRGCWSSFLLPRQMKSESLRKCSLWPLYQGEFAIFQSQKLLKMTHFDKKREEINLANWKIANPVVSRLGVEGVNKSSGGGELLDPLGKSKLTIDLRRLRGFFTDSKGCESWAWFSSRPLEGASLAEWGVGSTLPMSSS